MTILPIELVRNQFCEEGYLSFLDVDALLSMSQVSKTGQQKLSNAYFQSLFQKLHSTLANSPYTFQVLRTFHPDKCWKVACWVLAGPYRQISNFNLLREAPIQLPSIMARIEHRLLQLNGSYYQDPQSELHQAWLQSAQHQAISMAFESLKAERDRLMGHHDEISRKLGLVEGLKNISLEPKWILSHHNALTSEIEVARNAEVLCPEDGPRLLKCRAHIQRIFDNMDEQHPVIERDSEDIRKLHRMINKLYNSGRIWHLLHIQCGRNAQEEQWSENHFHEFLDSLLQIIELEFQLIHTYQNKLREGEYPPEDGIVLQIQDTLHGSLSMYPPKVNRTPGQPVHQAVIDRVVSQKMRLVEQLVLSQPTVPGMQMSGGNAALQTEEEPQTGESTLQNIQELLEGTHSPGSTDIQFSATFAEKLKDNLNSIRAYLGSRQGDEPA